MLRRKLLVSILFLLVVSGVTAQETQVDVYSIRDLPEPDDKEIKLESFKNYVFHGTINIKDNYIMMQGGALTGIDPGKDGVVSSYPGPIIQSKRNTVLIENFTTVIASDEGSGYLFEDPAGKKYCNLFSGHNVVEAPGVKSKGAGTIKGFDSVSIDLGFYDVVDGLKIGGNVTKLLTSFTYFINLENGIAIEFLDDADIERVILNDNFFVARENRDNIGVKLNSQAKVNDGRVVLNFFKGFDEDMSLVGFDPYSTGWEMKDNGSEIPNSSARIFAYMENNTESTQFEEQDQYRVINGNTTEKVNHKFESIGDNKFVYRGLRSINVNLKATVVGNSSNYEGSYTIAFKKNGIKTIKPTSTVKSVPLGNPFSLNLSTLTKLDSGDEISLYIRSNKNQDLKPVIVKQMTIDIQD